MGAPGCIGPVGIGRDGIGPGGGPVGIGPDGIGPVGIGPVGIGPDGIGPELGAGPGPGPGRPGGALPPAGRGSLSETGGRPPLGFAEGGGFFSAAFIISSLEDEKNHCW